MEGMVTVENMAEILGNDTFMLDLSGSWPTAHVENRMNNQSDHREFIHCTDLDGRICFVNSAWKEFAMENNWALGGTKALGSNLNAVITDPQTRHLYSLLMERVRESGRVARFGYRCDSPDCRRLMEMRMQYQDAFKQFEFRSRVLHMEWREPIALLDSRQATRSSDTLLVCSWCKSALADQTWVEVEQAVTKLRLFAADSLPCISHGICPNCSERMSRFARQARDPA
ncbi:MAG TPA: hypothetical protein DDY14_09815 [Chromatiaceae bacterium]|jgi:hypothetical protein|nr:MAG: hypothetical protein N838_15550 [Thiohalocapsa sp. PB-PSB1]HBG95595.1 hypothetical protein [Chromatiaceae bacterium]HCS92196.1 hypothetical protein [Chromatiaceae bacterium]